MRTRHWQLVTLQKPTVCADCGAELPAGTEVKSYSNGKVYGQSCHTRQRRGGYRRGEPRGLTLSRLTPRGVYTADGTLIGTTNRCEDAPCCGCCS